MNCSLKEYFKNIGRLFFTGNFTIETSKNSIPFQNSERFSDFYSKLEQCLLENKSSSLIFVVGEWGGGKTTHLRQFFSSKTSQYSLMERSFFGIQNLREAYLHLIPFCKRVLSVFIVVITFLLIAPQLQLFLEWLIAQGGLVANIVDYFSPILSAKQIVGVLSSGILLLFVTNKLKAFYALANAPDLWKWPLGCICKMRSRVIILEDLDRSSMTTEDRWALLTNLWLWKTKYIVPLGFQDEEQRKDIIEIAQKLGGQIIFLPLDPKTNFQICTSIVDYFPFEMANWMSLFSPRELIDIFFQDRFEILSEKKLLKQVLLIRKLFPLVSIKLGLNPIDNDLRYQLKGDRLSGNIRGRDSGLGRFQVNTVRIFYESISPTVVKNLLLVAKGCDKTSSNWSDVFIEGLFSKELSPNILDRLATPQA